MDAEMAAIKAAVESAARNGSEPVR